MMIRCIHCRLVSAVDEQSRRMVCSALLNSLRSTSYLGEHCLELLCNALCEDLEAFKANALAACFVL